MEFVGSMLIQIGIFTILATSFNLIIGYGGLMSIAHPIFFALGAYGSALLTQATGVPVPVGILFGMGLATVASIALALPSLRVSGDYLVIASIGFQLGLLQIIKNSDWSGGPGGLPNIPPLIQQPRAPRGSARAALPRTAARPPPETASPHFLRRLETSLRRC